MDRHWSGCATTLLACGCLMLGACSASPKAQVQASLTHSEDPEAVSLEQIVDETYNSMFSLMAPLYLFYAERERWPATAQELQRLTRELGLSFDLARFSQLEMRELQDGSLLVHFELASPSQGGGEFVLARPEFDEPPSKAHARGRQMI